jgi:hypothetical protein
MSEIELINTIITWIKEKMMETIIKDKEALNLIETDIKDKVEVKKFRWERVVAVITLSLAIAGGGGFLGWYYIWRDIHPQHDYINWTYTMPYTMVNNSGDVTDTTKSYKGRIPIKEGDNKFDLPHQYFKGNCFVYKQDKTLSLQATLSDEYNDVGIGPRVTDGCSHLEYKQFPFRNSLGDPMVYEFECCWEKEEK